MSETVNHKSINIIFPITAILSFALAFGVCSPFGAVIISGIALLIFPTVNYCTEPVFTVFLISEFIYGYTGIYGIAISVITAVLLSIIFRRFSGKFSELFDSPAFTGLMLATAITVTVLKTNDYFGIGASGITTGEMIKSYLSNGFHPNWRGILYGTIVMVIMITFPRKFKTASKVVSAAFIAVVFTYILNLMLIPDGMIKAVREVGNVPLNPFNGFKTEAPDIKAVLTALLSGIALWIICTGVKRDSYRIEKSHSILFRVIAAVIFALLLVMFRFTDVRITVSSLAVVLIVGAWQGISWKNVKNAFRFPIPFISFVSVLLITLLTNPVIGAILSVLISLKNEKKKLSVSDGVC